MNRIIPLLLLSSALAAEEIPASQVLKVDHREGFTIQTDHGHTASEALLRLKGSDKPFFGLVVEGGGTHYYTISRPNKDQLVGEGKDVKYVLDQKAGTFTVIRAGKRVVEKITTTLDS
ncbi:hypothetical protein JST97_11355 [bacterium]|nr:hypothetical protein [bacterium]